MKMKYLIKNLNMLLNALLKGVIEYPLDLLFQKFCFKVTLLLSL